VSPPTLENVGSCAELSPICFDVANGLLLVAAPVGWPPPSVLFGLGRQASSGGVTLAEYGERWYNKQDGFEVGLLQDDWGNQRVPLCISHQGLFLHNEIDG